MKAVKSHRVSLRIFISTWNTNLNSIAPAQDHLEGIFSGGHAAHAHDIDLGVLQQLVEQVDVGERGGLDEATSGVVWAT